MAITLSEYGPHGWLVKASDELLSLAARVDSNPPIALSEWVMGYNSLLLLFETPQPKEKIRDWLFSTQNTEINHSPTLHSISVRYDGPDLDEALEVLSLSKDEIIHLHTKPDYTVLFLGFAPGFAYLEGLPEKLHFPRRSMPRARMEAGAVAIGGSHAGIYTVPSPGGWNWLGNTDHPLFLPNEEQPFVLKAGDILRFIPES